MSGWNRDSSSFRVGSGFRLFHAPCGLAQMLRRFNTSDHTALSFAPRIAPEQRTVAKSLRRLISCLHIPRTMSGL